MFLLQYFQGGMCDNCEKKENRFPAVQHSWMDLLLRCEGRNEFSIFHRQFFCVFSCADLMRGNQKLLLLLQLWVLLSGKRLPHLVIFGRVLKWTPKYDSRSFIPQFMYTKAEENILINPNPSRRFLAKIQIQEDKISYLIWWK